MQSLCVGSLDGETLTEMNNLSVGYFPAKEPQNYSFASSATSVSAAQVPQVPQVPQVGVAAPSSETTA
jgi:hypothetical protein